MLNVPLPIVIYLDIQLLGKGISEGENDPDEGNWELFRPRR